MKFIKFDNQLFNSQYIIRFYISIRQTDECIVVRMVYNDIDESRYCDEEFDSSVEAEERLKDIEFKLNTDILARRGEV